MKKKSDPYSLRIIGSKVGIFWEYFGNFSRFFSRMKVFSTTGLSTRQRAGTLERVIKYDQEALSKAWDYLAKSPSDDEEE